MLRPRCGCKFKTSDESEEPRHFPVALQGNANGKNDVHRETSSRDAHLCQVVPRFYRLRVAYCQMTRSCLRLMRTTGLNNLFSLELYTDALQMSANNLIKS
jgi:hypothetical protein